MFVPKKVEKEINYPKVMFFADRHAYLSEGVRLVSATGLVSEYEHEFDEDYWLTSGAIKKAFPDVWAEVKKKHFPGQRKPHKSFFNTCANYLGAEQIAEVKKQRKILAHQWDVKNATACYRGSKFHLLMEQKDLTKKSGVVNPFTKKRQKVVARPCTIYCDNSSITDRLEDLEDGFYPELLIFHIRGDKGLVGQVDRAWIWTDKKTSERFYASDDWKTNWDKRNKSSFHCYKGILRHLRQSKTNSYSLQASIYAYMMELAGFTVKHLQITYVKDFSDNVKDVRVLEYLHEEVEQMFKEYFDEE